MDGTYQSVCYCTNLRKCANAASVFYDRALDSAGLTIAQYYLLINLSRMGTANITHWAQRVGLDRSTMTRNVKLLQSRDLIESAQGHGKTFTLSQQGKEMLDRAVPLWEEAQRQVEEILGEEDAQALLRICGKLQEGSSKI